jgi:rod shape-determining protein MreD
MALILILAAALQVSLFPRLAVQGVQPDPLLVCVMVAGLLYGPQVGAVMGLVAGWFTCALQGNWPGSFLVSRIVTGYFSGYLASRMFKEKIIIHIGGAFLGTLLATALFLLICPEQIRQAGWQKQALFGAFYNAALAPLVYCLFTRAKLNFERD